MNNNIDRLDRTRFVKAHSDTMYVQPFFSEIDHEQIKKNAFAYNPCWGILDAGMTMEKHNHPIAEFYVFTKGEGSMTLGGDTFGVKHGMSVNIPPNVDHEVTNPENAVEPLIWVSIGLKE